MISENPATSSAEKKNPSSKKNPSERLPTIQDSVTKHLSEVVSSANELTRIYDSAWSKPMRGSNDGHDAYCEYLHRNLKLIQKSAKLIRRAVSDATRFSASTSFVSSKLSSTLKKKEDIRGLIEEDLGDMDVPELIQPKNGPKQQKFEHTALVHLQALQDQSLMTTRVYSGDFSLEVLSSEKQVNFIGFDVSSGKIVLSQKTSNGSFLLVRHGSPGQLFLTIEDMALNFTPMPTKAFVFFSKKVVLISKGNTLNCFVKPGTVDPVMQQGTFDQNTISKIGFRSEAIASNFDSAERIQISAPLIAALTKDRKNVITFNPEKLHEKITSAVVTAFAEVSVFSMYPINSQKRKDEVVLFISEPDGSLYHIISSQPIQKEKPKSLIKIPGLVDVFYVENRLFILRKEKGHFIVQLYIVDSGEAQSATFTLTKQSKDFKFEYEEAKYDAARLGVLTQLDDYAEAQILIFGRQHFLKYSPAESANEESRKRSEGLLIFDQVKPSNGTRITHTINSIIPKVSGEIKDKSPGQTGFILSATIAPEQQSHQSHLINLEFNFTGGDNEHQFDPLPEEQSESDSDGDMSHDD